MSNNINDSMQRVQDKLGFIQQSFDGGNYEIVVKECCGLFELAFKRIFREAISSLDYTQRNQIVEKEREIGKGKKGAQDFTLGELVGLFRECDLMKRWAQTTNRDIGLIDTINYNSIVKLRNDLVHEGATCSRFEAELILGYLKNLFATLGFINFESAIRESFEATAPKTNYNEKEMVNIALIKERGIIINQSDESRNISFKVETINRMLATAYERFVSEVSEEAANQMLFDMGYSSGSAFGQVMNKKWEIESEEVSYEEKIRKWCEFDSVVGWGKFDSHIEVDLEEGEVKGYFEIHENFLCYNRKKSDVKLCEMMKGYCTGVLEELFDGMQLTVVCDENHCPYKNKLKNVCKFSIQVE